MISIVIPALNEERFLPDCLKSLRNQDYSGEYEIIIADNGSTDNTIAIATKSGVKVIHCSEQKSVFYARQVGADAASGDIIVQADADTVYPRGWLSRITRQFASRPEVVAVTGRFVYRDPPFWAMIEYLLRYAANFISILILGRPLVVSGATFAFRRSAFAVGNGYHGLVYAADQYGIACRLRKFGKVLYDSKLCVFTSARRVQKPAYVILFEFAANINRWLLFSLKYSMGCLHEAAVRSARRRMVTRLVPICTILIFFAVYGYFVPQSPVFGKVYYEGKPLEEVVALTFDDGPNEPYTSQILDILREYDIKATFFMIGKNVELYPDVARRVVAEGHVIGNHSYSHLANHALSSYGCKDMVLAQRVIQEVVGVSPHLYRPPHGRKTPWELADVKRSGLLEVTWSVSTGDLNVSSPEKLAERIVDKVGPGEIILLHDGFGTSHNTKQADKSMLVKALPLIIVPLQARGFKFTTVPKLLNVSAYED